jgi:hypothetical protein
MNSINTILIKYVYCFFVYLLITNNSYSQQLQIGQQISVNNPPFIYDEYEGLQFTFSPKLSAHVSGGLFDHYSIVIKIDQLGVKNNLFGPPININYNGKTYNYKDFGGQLKQLFDNIRIIEVHVSTEATDLSNCPEINGQNIGVGKTFQAFCKPTSNNVAIRVQSIAVAKAEGIGNLKRKIDELERSIKAEEEKKKKAEEQKQQFSQTILKAQLYANEGRIDLARSELNKARSLSNNDPIFLNQIAQVERVVDNKVKEQANNISSQQQNSTTYSSQNATGQVGTSEQQNSSIISNNRPITSTLPSNTQPSDIDIYKPLRDFEAQQAEIRREEQSMNIATEKAGQEAAQGNYIGAGRIIADEFLQQGNGDAAIASVTIGAAVQIGSIIAHDRQVKKAREEANQERAAEAQRIREEEERKEKEIFDQMIHFRKLILNSYSSFSEPIPLSSSSLKANKIYYFVFAINPEEAELKNMTIKVSNVFEIMRFNDGTWPYQKTINDQLYTIVNQSSVVLHGYYLSFEEASKNRTLFINDLRTKSGVTVQEFAYREAMSGSVTSGTTSNSLGVPIGGQNSQSNSPVQTNSAVSNPLGVPIKPLNNPTQNPNPAPQNNRLGVPIKILD